MILYMINWMCKKGGSGALAQEDYIHALYMLCLEPKDRFSWKRYMGVTSNLPLKGEGALAK